MSLSIPRCHTNHSMIHSPPMRSGINSPNMISTRYSIRYKCKLYMLWPIYGSAGELIIIQNEEGRKMLMEQKVLYTITCSSSKYFLKFKDNKCHFTLIMLAGYHKKLWSAVLELSEILIIVICKVSISKKLFLGA